MCIKTIYYNTYGDGFQDMTERVDTCVRGEMCRRPEIREFERNFRYNKTVSPDESSSSLASGTPATYHLRLPPTPRRSKSPSPHRRHKSGVYINDQKVVDIPSGKKRHSHHAARTDRDRVILHAPEPPAPARITRSSTMPTEYVTVENPSRTRGRDAERSHRRRSSSRDGSDHQDGGHRATKYYRRHVRGGSEFVLVDDERERRRARRSSTMYDRSSDFSSSAADSEAVKAAGKKLRWKDQLEAEIAAQNERISARPKLHQEVKGILKNPKGKDRDVYDDLRRAVQGLELKDQPSSSRTQGDDGYEYDADRLRARFGGDRKRLSRVSYGAGVYNYQ